MSMNCILERVAETQSTNDDLLVRWRAGQLTDPIARIAHKQTAGKGRAGRSWIANPNDTLCFSYAYPFQKSPGELSGLSLVVGLAVISGIAAALDLEQSQLYEQGLRLKWPNDLLLNNAKLGGILIEGGQAKANDPTWMVIGVGLNLRNAPSIENRLKDSSTQKVSAVDQLQQANAQLPDIEFFWLKLIEAFERYLPEFERDGFKAYQTQWNEWDAYKDLVVNITGTGKESVYGQASGVDSTGALILNQNGKMLANHAGDVSMRVQS